jgi:hypothetical protein
MAVLTGPQMMVYAQAAGFTGQSIIDAASVGMAESSGQTDIVNPSGNTGLMQIGPVGTRNDAGVGLTETQLKDPSVNMSAAHQIWARAGGSFAHDWTTWGGPRQVAAAALLRGTTVPATTPGVTTIDATNCNGLPPGPGRDLCVATGSGGGSTGSSGPDLSTLIGDAGRGAAWVSNPANWLHVVYVLGGIAVALVGLNILARPVIQPTVKTAKSIAKVGAAL